MEIFQTLGEIYLIKIDPKDELNNINDIGFAGLMVLERINAFLQVYTFLSIKFF